jgi:hypothetical protein
MTAQNSASLAVTSIILTSFTRSPAALYWIGGVDFILCFFGKSLTSTGGGSGTKLHNNDINNILFLSSC